MNINTHILNASHSLEFIGSLLKNITKEAIKHIVRFIPVDNVDIVFYDSPKGIIEHLGFGGRTVTENFVLIPVDPAFKSLKTSLAKNLPRTISHELYHCVRKYTYKESQRSLLDALINEGLADHFEIEVFGGEPQKWDEALNKKQITEYMKLVKKEFNNLNYNHRSWFYGSRKENIPRWTGYTIGFKLVGDYLKSHPDKKPSDLYKIGIEEFMN